MSFRLSTRVCLAALVGWLAIGNHASAQTGRATNNAESVCALSGPVGSVLVQPDGKIVIAGGGNIFFLTPESGTIGCLNGTVARFHPDGALDYGFGCRAEPPNYVNVFDTHLARHRDGRFLMTGSFNKVDGAPRSRLAMLSANGKLDSTFIPWRDEPDRANKLGQPRFFNPPQFYPAALDSSNQVIFPGIVPEPASGGLRVRRMDDSGRVLEQGPLPASAFSVAGGFLSLLSDRGLGLFRPVNWENAERTEWSLNPPKARHMPEFFQSAESISAGDAAEVLKTIFAELPMELCRNAVRLPDGGAILLVQDGELGRLMRFDKNWQADLSYTNSLRARGYVSLALQADGKLLIPAARGSDLDNLTMGSRPGVVRVNTNGVIDRSFRCDTDERVMSLAVQADGKILIGGFFRRVNDVEAPFFARLNADGSVDESFQRRFSNFGGVMNGRRVPVVSVAAAGTGNSTSANAVPPNVVAPTVVIQSLTLMNGEGVLRFQGAANRDYILQARNALDAGEWFNVETNRTDANGVGTLRDVGAKDSAIRFYRVATP